MFLFDPVFATFKRRLLTKLNRKWISKSSRDSLIIIIIIIISRPFLIGSVMLVVTQCVSLCIGGYTFSLLSFILSLSLSFSFLVCHSHQRSLACSESGNGWMKNSGVIRSLVTSLGWIPVQR